MTLSMKMVSDAELPREFVAMLESNNPMDKYNAVAGAVRIFDSSDASLKGKLAQTISSAVKMNHSEMRGLLLSNNKVLMAAAKNDSGFLLACFESANTSLFTHVFQALAADIGSAATKPPAQTVTTLFSQSCKAAALNHPESNPTPANAAVAG